MKTKSEISRRAVFQTGGMAAVAGMLAAPAAASAAAARLDGADVYARLGVRPFLNLTGAYTINGGMLTLPEVKKAADQASRSSVHIDELMAAVGKRLAELIQCEYGIVTSGCAAALTHATSASIAGGDPERIQQLPDLTGLKDEVVMLSRYTYDHAIRSLGVKMTLVRTKQEFYRALGPRTAMIGLTGAGEARGPLRLEEIAAAARERNIPVLVDAAAHYPQSPDPYLTRGADLVAYSGGKMYRGPQCAGFLFGRKDLVQAAWLNAAPHHAFGRAMKVGKEEIMGALAAVEARFSRRNYDDEVEMWSGWLEIIAKRLNQIPGLSTELVPRPPSNPHPYLTVTWDPAKIGLTGGELHDILIDGNPRLQTLASGDGHSFPLRVTNIEREHVEAVAERLDAVLRAAPGPSEKKRARPIADISGRWDIELSFVRGASKHRFYLKASGNTIAGTHHGRTARGEISGTIDGARVEITSQLPLAATALRYQFSGRLSGDEMSGKVVLGEYGPATWTARRT